LKEARTAGTFKKIFKRLDPEKIQRDIDLATIAIDSRKRIIGELTNRLDELKKSYSKKDNDIINARAEAQALLNRIGLTVEALEIEKRRSTSEGYSSSRIAEINRQLEELQKKILTEQSLFATT